MAICISLFIGLLLGGCGVIYKIGCRGNVTPNQNAAVLSLVGMIGFGVLGHAEWSALSYRVVLAGLLFGATQYLGMRLLRKALALGPLSPAWCAQSLSFVLVIMYSAACLDEKLSIYQYFALAVTIGAIVSASFESDGGTKLAGVWHVVRYGLLLVGLLVSFSILSIGLKFGAVYCEPGQTVPMVKQSGRLLMCFTYVVMGIACAIEVTLEKGWVFNRVAVITGIMLPVFSIANWQLTMQYVTEIPAMTLFAVSNATSILTAAILSVLCFQEKKSIAWACTVGFALAAILLNR